MENLYETQQKVRKLEEAIKKKEELKNSDKEFDRFNEDVLRYLRAKFPEESDAAIQEAVAFISYRTAKIILEMNNEMNDEMVKFYGDMTRKMIELIGGKMK